jgi:hypothetical protein
MTNCHRVIHQPLRMREANSATSALIMGREDDGTDAADTAVAIVGVI